MIKIFNKIFLVIYNKYLKKCINQIKIVKKINKTKKIFIKINKNKILKNHVGNDVSHNTLSVSSVLLFYIFSLYDCYC